MRELKAGLGLVFGNLTGRFYFVFILAIWILTRIAALFCNIDDIKGNAFGILFLWLSPVLAGASILGAGFNNVLSCGGLYCVPHLIKGLARFSVISAFIIAFMCSLVFLEIKGLNGFERCVYMAISFSLITPAFLASSIPLQFTSSKYPFKSIIRILWLVIFLRLIFAAYLGIQLIEDWPVIVIAGIFLCVIYCRSYTNKLEMAQRQIIASVDSNGQPDQGKLTISPVVEQFFIGRLTRCSQNQKYVWGAIYPYLGFWLSSWRILFWVMFAVTLFTGFFGSSPIVAVIMIIIVFMQDEVIIKSPVYSQMLISGGRSQRFYGTIASAIGALIFFGLTFVLTSIISWIIASLIPPFVFRGQTITFTPMPMYSPLIIIILIPLLFGISLCSTRTPLITSFFAFLFTVIFGGIAILFISPKNIILVPIILFVISWGFFVFVSRRICKKKDLILQTDKI